MLTQQVNQKLDHAWIESHIPHQGSMCLLSNVLAWDQEKITCLADSHRTPDNPLRAHGKLGISCGIEYAAQAMAVHGALLAPADSETPKVGYLVSVRGVTMAVTRLDDIVSDLLITAVCIMASESNMLYQFTVSADDKLLLEGRAAVVLDADALAIK
ncbi:MAG: hotdog family protein [Methylotenera sp.]|uniref:hotdog family protein n=1 Tax=Methylotenera sp. TaxID=2051956 RepID=UPI002487A281|nr:hotdog family protein [Methylotenera sp.]MDI1308687.1 hotdog family protein [Methylotenera sp.]